MQTENIINFIIGFTIGILFNLIVIFSIFYFLNKIGDLPEVYSNKDNLKVDKYMKSCLHVGLSAITWKEKDMHYVQCIKVNKPDV